MKTNANISQALTSIAGLYGERIALTVPVDNGYHNWTFNELENHVNAYAHGLAAQGINCNDRAILMVKPSLEFIGLTFALFRLGIPVVLIDPGMGYRNLLRCIASVKPTVFIGIPKAQLFRKCFSKPFQTIRTSICVGNSFGLLGKSLRRIADFHTGPFPTVPTTEDDLAAIIFTTGSTGPPKGVRYQHGIFQSQRRIIRDYYQITHNDIDQPAFPLFALFSTALGARAVLPDMDAAHPARVNPARFIRSIIDQKVTYSFGSPAIWNVVSRYCLDHEIKLSGLKKVLMAGAPVSGELIDRVRRIIADDGTIHTPYGATESLPTASITGREVLDQTWEQTRKGRGTCVGKAVPGMDITIIPVTDGPIVSWEDMHPLPPGEIGEIVVKGPVVTSGYEYNDTENRLAKIKDGSSFRHRMGDVGYLDAQDRLWFCGRKAHRVQTVAGDLYTIQCEAIFNEHPAVLRSALVGIGKKIDEQRPVIIVELHTSCDQEKLFSGLKKLALANPITKDIENFLVHDSFPVDIRHNAKIFREKLAVWAATEIGNTL